MQITVSVLSEAVLARLLKAPEKLRRSIFIAVTKLSIEIQSSVKEDKLTGQVLHNVTGTLRRSIARKVTQTDTGVYAVIGTRLNYGIGWELGFDRKIGAGARGGPRTLLGLARERYIMKHPPGVKHEPARPFLKPTLEEFAPKIKEDIRKAAIEALR